MLIGLGILLATALYTASYILSANLLADPTYLNTTYLPTPDFQVIVPEMDPTNSLVPVASQGQQSTGYLHPNPEEIEDNSPYYNWFPSMILRGDLVMEKEEQIVSLSLNQPPLSSSSPSPNPTGIPLSPVPSLSTTGSTPTPPEVTSLTVQPATETPTPVDQSESALTFTTETIEVESTENPASGILVMGSETSDATATPSESDSASLSGSETPQLTPLSVDEPSSPELQISPSQVVMIKIPKLRIERPVVEIGLVKDSDGRLKWDTDSLFATRNRADLVGHLVGSALPGEGGNVVLAGHNYDWGKFQWNGVFNNLRQLKPGDQILILTEAGDKIEYVVDKVKLVPFSNGDRENLSKHFKFMGPKNSEQLTLVTCGGANFFVWNKRVYVSAVPRADQR